MWGGFDTAMNIRNQNRPVEILLVEDSPGDVRLAQEALQETQIPNHLHVVNDGEKALEFLHRVNGYHGAVRPDLILLDLNLPRKDGREVLQAVKTDKRLKRIPVVVLTTSDAEQDILETYDLHANCYITKPVDFDKFVEVIHHIGEFWLRTVRLPEE
jgi:CheY-like chemotaxis protein